MVGPLKGSPCAFIVLNGSLLGTPSALRHYAALRLVVEKVGWLRKRQRGDIRGYRIRVTVEKNKLAAPGKSVLLKIEFNGTVKGNGI